MGTFASLEWIWDLEEGSIHLKVGVLLVEKHMMVSFEKYASQNVMCLED